ncbi:putative phosphoglycerate mutase [Klebsormidium nitens]|uniref:Putative phosphoglycerate mutase n=1 Tax=Klebsormidium nitens TaxID=105231 RepID=A0A0U9HJE7_KLENI|nr:putative phosphoglycerate mutase [Klebsormidium nitens]|eukprot:GAQ82030.1 putative phosphoglycerate mutase [Klebsormidium nitens]
MAEEIVIEVYLVRHGESTANVHPSIVGGRSQHATLTTKGAKQAKALGAYLRDYLQLTFDAVYASSLVRAYDTAAITCLELGIPEREIHVADDLQEMSQGEWEGRPRAEVYTPDVLASMPALQPNFTAPGGESQLQVETRMRHFVEGMIKEQLQIARRDGQNGVVPQTGGLGMGREQGGEVGKSEQELREDELSASLALLDLRRQAAKGNGAPEAGVSHHPDSDLGTGVSERSVPEGAAGLQTSALEANGVSDTSAGALERPVRAAVRRRVALFGHGMAIKCFLRGILQSDPKMTHKIFLENSSVTLLKFTTNRGWHVTKVNDTAHLVLARRAPQEDRKEVAKLPGGTYRYST